MKHSSPFLCSFASLAFSILSTNALAAEPIAKSDGDISGARVEVMELKRSSGGTLTLKFVMYNDDPSKSIPFNKRDFGDQKMQADYGSVGGVHLIDAANKKKYLVVRDSAQNCVCSRDLDPIKPGGKASLWAKFPAPPEDVKKVSIVVPHFIPMDDVPISN